MTDLNETDTPSGLTHVPVVTDDPKPPDANASAAEWTKYKKLLHEYSSELLEFYQKDSSITGELLLCDFTTIFSETGIENLRKAMQMEWRTLLTSRGVFVKQGRNIRQVDALIECKLCEEWPRPPDEHSSSVQTRDNNLENNQHENSGLSNAQQNSPNSTDKDKNATESQHENMKTESSRDEEADKKHREQNSQGQYSEDQGSRLGLQGLSRLCQKRSNFSGSFDDDLVGTIREYRSLAQTCQLSETEMARGIPMILEGDAMTFYSENLSGVIDFEKIVSALQKEFTSEEQRNRLLRVWQRSSLLECMRNNPEKSEVAVFRDMCRTLSTTQRQLHESYHHDNFLRDQIMVATDVEELDRSLREKIPKSSHEAIQRIANLLSNVPGSAGRRRVRDERAFYGIGARFGGDARRKTRFPPRKKRTHENQPQENLRAGCIVCSKDHMARNHHSREAISQAVRKKRNTKNKAFVTDEHSSEHASDAEHDDGSLEDDQGLIGELSDSEDGSDHAFHTSVVDVNRRTEISLSNNCFSHGLYTNRSNMHDEEMNAAFRPAESGDFEGIIMDTACNRASMMSLEQYKIYCRDYGVVGNINGSNARSIRGIGSGKLKTLGSAVIPVPFPEIGLTIEVDFHISEQKTPTLLSLRDMKNNLLDLRVLQNTVSFNGKAQKLHFIDGFLVHKWSPKDDPTALFSEGELRKLHRSFGHPTVSSLSNVLRRARPEQFDSSVPETLQEISEECQQCQKNGRKPRRFKLSVGTEDLRFNHVVAIDIMYIEGMPLLHVVDEATHFMSASFLANSSTAEVWKALRRCWTNVYLGPPDFLRVDQGSNLVSHEFKSHAAGCDMIVLEAPVEHPSTMSHVERYHSPLRGAYIKLREDLGKAVHRNEVLQMAVKAVNDTVGPEGLCPTLLVFGSIPRPARTIPSPTQLQRAKAAETARREVERIHADRKVKFALKYKGPYGRERNDLYDLPHGAEVLVYREKDKKWTGPHTFISIEGDTVIVQTKRGRKIFRSHVVKPLKRASAFSASTSQPKRVQMKPNEKHNFVESRKKELDGLWKKNVFQVVKRSKVPSTARIHKSKFIDELRINADGSEQEKSRLVAANFYDPEAETVSTRSPTVTRLSQRLVVNTASMFPKHAFYIRDVTQSYTQSKKKLVRFIYLEPVAEMNLAEDEVLLAVRPLYGIPESGLYWFATYHGHHIDFLGMDESKADRCLLYKHEDGELKGVTVLQVDDSAGHGTTGVLNLEEEGSRSFQCKPRQILKQGMELPFNGTMIRRNKDDYEMRQPGNIASLQEPTNAKDAISTRAALQYIAGCTRPDLASATQLLSSSVAAPTEETYKKLSEIINRAKETSQLGLRYCTLDHESTELYLFTDASFGNAENGASQTGFVLCLVDKHGNANILHYGSQRCRRVTRSVMAAELLALSYGFDNGFVAKTMLEELLGREAKMHAFIDSRTVFNTITKCGSTLEKRLQIEAFALRQSHERGELSSLSWIKSDENVADALTKTLPPESHILYNLLRKIKLNITPQGWVENNMSNLEKLQVSQARDLEISAPTTPKEETVKCN